MREHLELSTLSSFWGPLHSDAKASAQQLYDWLIRPIAAELQQANAQTLIYAPDGQLRYIPLAALHDGEQWLIQQYQINHITATNLSNWDVPPAARPRIFAGAFATGRYHPQPGRIPYPMSGLPFAGAEVEAIASLFPNTTKLVDQAFNQASTLQMNDHTIVHMATHAMFVTGQPEDSFIMLGDGSWITLRDVNQIGLGNVDLVVLSGCETAVSTLSQDDDGKEILGFGYQIQQAGARAAIASLWRVNDGGTQVLMSHFYELLHRGNLTKTTALQQAQIALIQQKAVPSLARSSQLSPPAAAELAHPYYWAPFILIGNGL